MPVFPTAVAGPTSLTAGWKVELGIGDPAQIGDVGVYDTSRYPDVYMSGTWLFGSAAFAGWFSTISTGIVAFNNIDDDGVDRRAELLAVPVGSVLSVGGSDMTVLFVDHQAGDVRLGVAQDDIPNMIQNSYYEMRVFAGANPPRYGSDDLFGYLVDVTSRVEGLSTTRGRERFTARFRTGTAQVTVLNTDGAFTPPSGSGPLGILPLRPGRAVRITNNGADVFSGFIDSFTGYQGTDGKVSTSIMCVDQFGQFTRNDLPAVPPEGSGDSLPVRMRRLLDHHLDNGYRFMLAGTGEATFQSTEMAQDLMSELALTADSEGGGVWVGKSGDIVASGRDFFSDIAEAGLVKWSVGGTNPITIQSYTDEWAAIRILNEAHMSRAGGTEQVRTNDLSIGQFGRRTHTRLDLICDDDVYVGALAERLVQFAGVDRLRITGLTFLPDVGSDAASMAVEANFGDLLLVTISTMFGVEWTAPVQVFGIQHSVSDEVWEASFLTDDTLFIGEFYAFHRDSFDNDAFS